MPDVLEEIIKIGYPQTTANPYGLPLPTQERFHDSRAKYRLLAGGFATGKTTSLCIEILYECLNFNNNYGVLGRKDLGELKSTTLKELLDICPSTLIKNHNKQDHTLEFMNGSQIYYMNLDDSREAVEKIKSLNLGFVAIDQLEEINESVFFAFQGRLRRYNSNRNFFATCNPAGHDWVWDKFKNNPQQGYELFEAITTENIYLPPDYVSELLGYPEKWVKRFVYCSWDDFEGIVYSEFVEKLHRIPYYTPSETENKYISLDYGFRNPTGIGFFSVDYDNVARMYDEYYEPGKLISEISDAIKEREPNYKRILKIADPSIFNVQRDGKSVADEFADNGIYFIPADNSVSQGINRVNELFRTNRLLIGENCINWFKEQSNYKWKEIKSGLVRNEYEEPTKKNDHCFVAGTQIATDKGYKSIEKIKEGDYILTRAGFRRVLLTHETKNQEVFYYPSLNLTSTSAHLVYTEKGFKVIHNLTQSDILAILDKKEYIKCLNTEYQKQLKLMELNLGAIPIHQFLTTGIITGVVKTILSRALDIYTFMFGNKPINKKSLKAIISTTKMATRIIMKYRIWNLKLSMIIFPSMQNNGTATIKRLSNHTYNLYKGLLLNGINQKKVESGTVNKQRNLGLKESYQFAFANNAGKNINLYDRKYLNSATPTVKQRIDAVYKGYQNVFNLTVEGQPEYYANNILVHNCMDLTRYFVNYFYAPRKVEEEIVARPFLRKQQSQFRKSKF